MSLQHPLDALVLSAQTDHKRVSLACRVNGGSRIASVAPPERLGGFGQKNAPKDNFSSEALVVLLHKIKTGTSSRHWRSVAHGYW